MSDDRSRLQGALRWILWPLAMLGMAVVVCVFLMMVLEFPLGRRGEPARVAAGQGEARETFVIRNVGELHGTNLVQMDIALSLGGKGSYSGRRDDRRNILLLDKATGNSRTILPDNSRRIVDSTFLPAKADIRSSKGTDDAIVDIIEEDRDDAPPPAYYVVEIASGPGGELIDVLVGTLDTGRQDYVMRGIEGIDQIWMQNPTQIGFIIRDKLTLYYRIVDIPTLKVTNSRRIDLR